MHECTVDDVHACHVDLGADCAVRVCVWWLLAGWLAGVFLPDTASHLCIHVWRGWRRRLCFRQGALESSLGNMLQCPVDTAHAHTAAHMLPHDASCLTRARAPPADTGIGDEGAKALAEALKVNTTVTSIDLKCKSE